MNIDFAQIVFVPLSEVYKNAVEVFQKASKGQPIIILKNSQPLGAIVSLADFYAKNKGA